MVLRLVADVAGLVLLLEPADHVLKALRPRQRPGAGQPLVAHVGPELPVAVGLGREAGIDPRQVRRLGQGPRLGRVGQEGVGEQDHRRAVADRDPDRLEDRLEALGRGRGSDHRQRRLAVAAVDRHQQVGGLGLGRHPGRGAGPLGVDHQQRQLQGDGEADRLRLQVHAGAAGDRDAEMAAEGGAERHVRGGDLVLGLHGADAEALVARELVQELGGGRDRVAGEEQRQAAADARRDQPQGRRLRPVDAAVGAGLGGGGLDLVVDLKQLGRLAEVVAGPEGGQVRLHHRRRRRRTSARSSAS